jgi:hypothetical protein
MGKLSARVDCLNLNEKRIRKDNHAATGNYLKNLHKSKDNERGS